MTPPIDPDPGFREELLAAIAVLDPEIDGLQDLMNASISAEAKDGVALGLVDRSRRRDLERSLIQAMDLVNALRSKLKNDGYPSWPTTIFPRTIVDELKKESDSMLAAPAGVAAFVGLGK